VTVIAESDTLVALEWPAICELLANQTNAESAAAALRALKPLPDVEVAHKALAEVAEGMEAIASESALPAPFVIDQASTVRALGVEGATLDGPTLISAARTFEGTRKLATFLKRNRDRWPRLATRFEHAPVEPQLERTILDAFDREAKLVDEASRELGRFRQEVRRLRTTIVERLNALIADLPHVLVAVDSQATVRDDRYVVPLRREALSEVPGIVHDESASGATIFVEPSAMVDSNNALRRAGLAVRREEERILGELTRVLAERRGELEHAARLALHAETVLARARYGLATNGHAPELGGDTLALIDAQHPLLIAHFDGIGVGGLVPLTLELGPDERTLVVTGPNTGGKTVLLKTIGVVVLMAQSGVVPPVGRGTRLPWHDSVFADIGDTQSIAQDLSTFTAHLTKLKTAWDGARDGSLILVDEIGASTDPAEGSALASALLEAWTGRRARTIVTTHYHELKVLAFSTDGIVNGSLAYDVERNQPRYRFVSHVPGRSFGIDLAERWGFDPAIIEVARGRLDSGVRDVEEVVGRLAQQEAAHREAEQALEAERKAIGEAATARAARETAEARSQREAAEQRLAELEAQLDRLRGEVREQQKKLRRRTAELAEAEADAERSRMLAAEADRASAELRAQQEALADERSVVPIALGDQVRIPRYDVVGEIVDLDRREDVAAVKAGQIRISCRASECELIESAADRAEPEMVAGQVPLPGDEDLDDVPLEVDLRGMTADEVSFPVAGALEQAYHTGRASIRFIHGKGTGVLRQRVAELLQKHPYVVEFRVGHWNEGGDGVTVVTMENQVESES
jgi:DNA mismatch repair protein MutS2